MELADDRGMVRREAVGETRVASVHRHRVLREIVGAHAEEVAHLGQMVADQHGRRRFHHDSDRDGCRGADPGTPKRLGLFHDDRPSLFHLFDQRDQRQHQVDIAVGRRPEDGANLRPEDFRLVETHADRSPPEEGIRLGGCLERDRELVAAEIERANDHRLPRKGGRDPAEILRLLVLGRHRRPAREEELGAQQSHTLRAHSYRRLDLLGQVYVPHELDRPPGGSDRRCIHHRLELELQPVAPTHLSLRLLELGAVGLQYDRPALAIEEEHGSRRDPRERSDCSHHGGYPERVRQNRGVGGAGSLLAHEPNDVLPVELHREPGRELVRHHDHLLVGGDRPRLGA